MRFGIGKGLLPIHHHVVGNRCVGVGRNLCARRYVHVIDRRRAILCDSLAKERVPGRTGDGVGLRVVAAQIADADMVVTPAGMGEHIADMVYPHPVDGTEAPLRRSGEGR